MRRFGNLSIDTLPDKYQIGCMTPLEKAVADLVRLGLNGDASSVRQYAQRLLRKAPAPDGSEAAFRDALAKLVLDESTTRRITRGLPREVEPTDVQDPLALAHVERPTDTIPPVLAPAAQQAVDRIINERRHVDLLARVGIEPTRKLLLTGAPGVGKTMTARYLAAELDLPLLTVDLAALISSFLGRTGHNLRRILDYARSSPSVLLLDEFDALGKRRDDPSDVGELKRIVNVLLVELERWPSESLLIAESNSNIRAQDQHTAFEPPRPPNFVQEGAPIFRWRDGDLSRDDRSMRQPGPCPVPT